MLVLRVLLLALPKELPRPARTHAQRLGISVSCCPLHLGVCTIGGSVVILRSPPLGGGWKNNRVALGGKPKPIKTVRSDNNSSVTIG